MVNGWVTEWVLNWVMDYATGHLPTCKKKMSNSIKN